MKVVIVGTPDCVRTGLGERLLARGHEVHAFANGHAALQHAECYEADVVVIDRALRDMAPSEVAAHLRHWASKSQAPVMIVTAPPKSCIKDARDLAPQE